MNIDKPDSDSCTETLLSTKDINITFYAITHRSEPSNKINRKITSKVIVDGKSPSKHYTKNTVE